jgi:hypothetical protein
LYATIGGGVSYKGRRRLLQGSSSAATSGGDVGCYKLGTFMLQGGQRGAAAVATNRALSCYKEAGEAGDRCCERRERLLQTGRRRATKRLAAVLQTGHCCATRRLAAVLLQAGGNATSRVLHARGCAAAGGSVGRSAVSRTSNRALGSGRGGEISSMMWFFFPRQSVDLGSDGYFQSHRMAGDLGGRGLDPRGDAQHDPCKKPSIFLKSTP